MNILTQLRNQTVQVAATDGGLAEQHHIVAAATLLDPTATRTAWTSLGFDADLVQRAIRLSLASGPDTPAASPALDPAVVLAPVEELFIRAADPAVCQNRNPLEVVVELACAARPDRKTLKQWARRLLRRAVRTQLRTPDDRQRPAARKTATVPADWLADPVFWFPPERRPRPAAERVENGPFGNDRQATPADLEPFLKDLGNGQHLPLFGVTFILENEDAE